MSTDGIAFQLLQNALQASSLRQQVYANNIANADTPGFKRSDVQFENVLQGVLQSGGNSLDSINASQALSVVPQITTDTSSTIDNNGNNVNVDDEMVSIAQNQLRYNILTQDLQERLARLHTAITGG